MLARQPWFWPGIAPRAGPRWLPSSHLTKSAPLGARHCPNRKAGPGSVWLPNKEAGLPPDPSSLHPYTPQCRTEEALTECSSWSTLWARTGLKDTGDRAPGFFLTARICKRARKAVQKGRAEVRQRGTSTSTTETCPATGALTTTHTTAIPGQAMFPIQTEQSHTRKTEARTTLPQLSEAFRGGREDAASLPPAIPGCTLIQ